MNLIRKHILSLAGLCFTAAHCIASSFVIDWTYEYGVGSPGTKSESVYGRLLYKGDELPKESQHVITPIGEFIYIDVKGGAPGIKIAWVPSGKLAGPGDAKTEPAHTETEVQELLTGDKSLFRRVILSHSTTTTQACLAGTFEKPPGAVGKDWFYVSGKDLWVNPKEISTVWKLKLSGKQ